MIYFDNLKNAYNYEIADIYGTDTEEKWAEFCGLTLGKEYDVKAGENCLIDLRQTPEYVAEQLAKAKENKFAENDFKLNEKRYGQIFSVILQEQECVFDTTEQTQSDLQTAAIVTSTGATYDNWVTNNGVTLNLTAEDVFTVFEGFFPLVSPLYSKDLDYKEQIENAQTVEEVNAIIIDYDE